MYCWSYVCISRVKAQGPRMTTNRCQWSTRNLMAVVIFDCLVDSHFWRSQIAMKIQIMNVMIFGMCCIEGESVGKYSCRCRRNCWSASSSCSVSTVQVQSWRLSNYWIVRFGCWIMSRKEADPILPQCLQASTTILIATKQSIHNDANSKEIDSESEFCANARSGK